MNREKKRLILFNKQKGKCCKCGKVLRGNDLSIEVEGVICRLPCWHEEWKRNRAHEEIN